MCYLKFRLEAVKKFTDQRLILCKDESGVYEDRQD